MTITNQRLGNSHRTSGTLRPALATNVVLSWTRHLLSAPRRLNDYVDRLEIGIIDFDPPSD